MVQCRSLARTGILCLTLSAVAVMPTAAASAGGSTDVAALKTANRALEAQIASANRSLGGRGTLAHRVRVLRKRLGGNGNAIQRALDAQRTVGGTGSLTRRSAALRARLGGSGSASRRVLAIEAILDGSGTLAQRAETAVQQAPTPTDSGALASLTAQNQTLGTRNAALENEVTAAKTTVGGSGTLSDRLGALGRLVGGSGSLTDAITAADDTLGGGGNLTDDSTNYVAAAGSTAATIVDAQSRIGGAGTLAARLDAVDSALGASGTILARLAGLSGSILTAPTGDLTADVATLGTSLLASSTGVLQTDLTRARELIGVPAATLQADLERVGQALDGTDPTAGAPIDDTLAGQVTSVRGGAPDLSSAISAVKDAVGGSDDAVYSKVSSLNERLGGTGSTTARTSAIHGAVLTTPGATVRGDLFTARGLLVSSPGATLQADLDVVGQTLNGTDPTGGAPIDDTLAGQVTSVRGGAPDLSSAISAVKSAVGGTDDTVYSKVNSLNERLGGTGSTTARTSAIHGALLTNPGASVREDLDTARNQLVASPGATLQADLGSLARLLNGTTNGSTLEARIGIPTVNGSLSSLSDVIGGSGTTLAAQLGDPVIGTGGLASLTAATSASNGGDVFEGGAFSALLNATTLVDQADAFLALMDHSRWSSPDATNLTFSLAAPPSSLGALIGQASSISAG